MLFIYLHVYLFYCLFKWPFIHSFIHYCDCSITAFSLDVVFSATASGEDTPSHSFSETGGQPKHGALPLREPPHVHWAASHSALGQGGPHQHYSVSGWWDRETRKMPERNSRVAEDTPHCPWTHFYPIPPVKSNETFPLLPQARVPYPPSTGLSSALSPHW